MRQIIISGALSLLAILLIPTGQARGDVRQISNEVPQASITSISPETQMPNPAETGSPAAPDGHTVRLLCGDTLLQQDETSYLCCVLLSEMPASFEPEALSAQCVAARTFFYRQARAGKHPGADVCTQSSCCQAWTSVAELKEKFGNDYDAVMEKALRAVMQTQGEVMTYDGALIDATYFSCSGGRTEDALAVWGTDMPYLRSVESFGEEAAPRYESRVEFSPDELAQLLCSVDTALILPENPEAWLGAVSYTGGHGVATMEIGNASFSGVQLRRILGLNSTQFTAAFENGAFIFDVKGFGHRVGMSQYGANFMAQQGYTYRQILQYYYSGVTIETLT